MAKSNFLVACLLALISGNVLAQGFPARPLTLFCPYQAASTPDRHLRAFAQIASKYLGQPVMVENKQGGVTTLGPATMATTARPDGYTLSQLTIMAFRVPHMARVTWDPLKDFTYVIALADFNFGVVVKFDSQFKTLTDLIDYAKANPGRLLYSSPTYGFTSHLVMEEMGLKAGARLQRVPGFIADSAAALRDGRIMAISDTNTNWGPHVDAGAFRLLATFGERRSRWNAPTAMELGLDILSYAPFGIVAPKGMDPKLTKLLHDAFKLALDDPEHMKLLTQLDFVYLYKSSEDYADWAVDQFRFQRTLIERTIGLGTGLHK